MPGSFREYDTHSARETLPIKQRPRKTLYEDSFSLLTCQRLLSSTPAVFHKRCFSTELGLKPMVHLLLVVINKRIALATSKRYVSLIHTLHWPGARLWLHVEDLHFVINNSVIIFRRVKKITHVKQLSVEELIYWGILRTET